MKKFLLILHISISLYIISIPSNLLANVIYVRADGKAASEGQAVGPCSTVGNTANLVNANSWANTGDTVILCDDGGNYSTSINPFASPTQESERITYQAASGDDPTITSSTCISLIRKDYITVDGVTCDGNFSNGGWVNMDNNGEVHGYNIIQNCTFINEAGDGNSGWGAIYLEDASYNQILNNTLTGTYCTAQDSDEAHDDLIYIKANSDRNLIYGNTINGGIHNALEAQSNSVNYNVISNNIMSNDRHSVVNLSFISWVLFEGNKLSLAGNICDDDADDSTCEENLCGSSSDRASAAWEHPGLQFRSQNAIVRRNQIFDNNKAVSWNPSSSDPIQYVRFYHNTLAGPNTAWRGIRNNVSGTNTNNVFKNNILYNITGSGYKSIDWDVGSSPNYFISNNVYNYRVSNDVRFFYLSQEGYNTITYYQTKYPEYFKGNIDVDPLFINAKNNDFMLKSGSTLIDKGTWLTQVNDSGGGTGTSLVVDDARYFYTTGSPWNTPGTAVADDTIYVDNPSLPDFRTTIKAINYNTNTLTLRSSQEWDDGAYVYFCPNGVCFSGSASDIGAFEYGSETQLVPPSNLKIIIEN